MTPTGTTRGRMRGALRACAVADWALRRYFLPRDDGDTDGSDTDQWTK